MKPFQRRGAVVACPALSVELGHHIRCGVRTRCAADRGSSLRRRRYSRLSVFGAPRASVRASLSWVRLAPRPRSLSGSRLCPGIVGLRLHPIRMPHAVPASGFLALGPHFLGGRLASLCLVLAVACATPTARLAPARDEVFRIVRLLNLAASTLLHDSSPGVTMGPTDDEPMVIVMSRTTASVSPEETAYGRMVYGSAVTGVPI